MLPSCFNYIFVHLSQNLRLRPDLNPKFLSTLGPKPNPTYNSAVLYTNNYIALPKFGVYHLTNYYGNRTILSLQF